MNDAPEQSTPPAAPTPGARTRWLPLACVLIVGLALRLLWLPGRHETRDVDEAPYTYAGLMLFEGMIPGHKAVPGGIQFWNEWAYVGARSAYNLLHPTELEKQVPLMARPVYVIDRAIFDIYRDISPLRNYVLWCNLAAGLAAILLAWKFGVRASGSWVGGLLSGGLSAVLPVYLFVGATSRPHAFAIALAIASLLAVGRCSIVLSAICFGLAVGTRMEMSLLSPLLAAAIISQHGWKSGLARLVRFVVVSVVTFMVIAPWWLMTWLGNIRSIAGVRILKPTGSSTTGLGTLLLEFSWVNGLAVAALLMICAWALAVQRRPRGWLVPAAATLIGLTLLTGGGLGIAYQLPVVMTVVLIGSYGIAALPQRAMRVAAWVVGLSIAAALGNAIWQGARLRTAYVHPTPGEWIEQHVPAGTRVYWPISIGKVPLPTEEAATRIWNEVSDDASWRTKMSWAVGSGGASTTRALPRATSDELMVKERAYARIWFVLGGRPEVDAPRFDLRQWEGSTIFGARDPVAEFQKTGGVLVWRGESKPAELGEPVQSWSKDSRSGVFIYVSPDVRTRLQ
jgi:hypothetical protein